VLRSRTGVLRSVALGVLVGAGAGAGCGGGEAEAPGVPIRAFDLMGDTAVILTDAEEPVLLFVPVRGGALGTPARIVELPYWRNRVTQLRTAGEWIFLGGDVGGVVLMSPDGERQLDREIVRPIPRGFAPGPDGVVYFTWSVYSGFHTAAAGPARAGLRPFARRLDPEPPTLSRARSGPGLDAVLVVDPEGQLVRFSNRSGVITRHAPDGAVTRVLPVPEALLAGAISRSSSGIGRPGAPLATALRLGCDGELVLTLGDRVRSVLRVELESGEVERVGELGRVRPGRAAGAGSGSGRVATLCEGRILAP
jgi:hypothetical protein